MDRDAPAWDGSGGDKPVVAHTPDPTRYHALGSEQASHMRGRSGVIIPRANSDGTSKGFDASRAGVVHVDPDMRDGGVVLDLSKLDPTQYYQALSRSQYPSEVFYRLGANAAPIEEEEPPPPVAPLVRENRSVPKSTYIAPPAMDDGTQLSIPKESPVKSMPRQVALLSPKPMDQAAAQVMPQQSAPQPMPQVPQQQQVPPQYQWPGYGYPPPQPQVDLSAFQQQFQQIGGVLSALGQQMQSLQQQVTEMRSAPSVPARAAAPRQRQVQPEPDLPDFSDETEGAAASPIPRKPRKSREEEEEDTLPRQTLRQYEEDSADTRDQVIVGFETLKMRFLNGPRAVRPEYEVLFELPEVGTIKARYHLVADGKNCLALVYDTRFVDGHQYSPPDLGDKAFQLGVPRMKKVFSCSSIGLHFKVGVLEIVVLIQHPDEVAEYNEQEDE